MHCFISAGEPSGDLHGGNLARALRQIDSPIQLTGLGGMNMRAAGVELLDPLAEKAIMGVVGVLKYIPSLMSLLERITVEWHRRRPDVVVLIDYPGFHWHLAARAKAMDIPVASFVPPQIWAWASHRIRKMRRNFDHVLCALPFEEKWFRNRGMSAEFIGHPYFDELARQQLDPTFVQTEKQRSGPIVALLPGSRGHEVRDNMLAFRHTARSIAAKRPDARFLVAAYRSHQRDWLEEQFRNEPYAIDFHTGRLPEIIHMADACVAVSGSVGLELLYGELPTVVIYRTSVFYRRIVVPMLINVPYISVVNLLAGRELFPEYLLDTDTPPQPSNHVVAWLSDSERTQDIVKQLAELKAEVAKPGACQRAAQVISNRYATKHVKAA